MAMVSRNRLKCINSRQISRFIRIIKGTMQILTLAIIIMQKWMKKIMVHKLTRMNMKAIKVKIIKICVRWCQTITILIVNAVAVVACKKQEAKNTKMTLKIQDQVTFSWEILDHTAKLVTKSIWFKITLQVNLMWVKRSFKSSIQAMMIFSMR